MVATKESLSISGLCASVEGKPILKGVNLSVSRGAVHAVMGPNGSGKSTLASVLMGHPGYSVDGGDILLGGSSILPLAPEERAKAGLFLGFQYPAEIPGVTLSNFLRTAYNGTRPDSERLSPIKFHSLLSGCMRDLGIPLDFADRFVNEGFSGGEKKRCEILQMAVLRPRFAILDETDSGLDVDSLRTVASGAANLARDNDMGVLLITHYARILDYIAPDFVHVFSNGRIVKSGGPELAKELERSGYAKHLPLEMV